MDSFSTIRDVIDLWPTRAALAEEMNVHLPDVGPRVTSEQVHKWAQKRAIPARYHKALLAAGQLRGLPITAGQIVDLHDPTSRAAA